VHGHDARVIELTRDARFVEESLQSTRRVAGESSCANNLGFPEDELQRQSTIEPRIHDAIDGTHRTAPDFLLELVSGALRLARGQAGDQLLDLGSFSDERLSAREQCSVDSAAQSVQLLELALEIRVARDEIDEAERDFGIIEGKPPLEYVLGSSIPSLGRGVRIRHARYARPALKAIRRKSAS
jgi:hypothetical protein